MTEEEIEIESVCKFKEIESAIKPGIINFIAGPMNSLKSNILLKFAKKYCTNVESGKFGLSFQELISKKKISIIDEIQFVPRSSFIIYPWQIIIIGGLIYDTELKIWPFVKDLLYISKVFQTQKFVDCAIKNCKERAKFDGKAADILQKNPPEKKFYNNVCLKCLKRGYLLRDLDECHIGF